MVSQTCDAIIPLVKFQMTNVLFNFQQYGGIENAQIQSNIEPLDGNLKLIKL